MEGYQAQARERSHPPYQRPASRSSTSTRMTSQSANSSASHISSSPQLQSAYAAHRHHYASAKLSSSPRPSSRAMPTPQLSREGSTESARQTPVSSFLQERLQKERQAESQKYTASTPRSNSDMSTSCELGSSQKSPVKQCGDGNRPQSSCGDPTQKKGGLALKEMEQVVSSLHKQNFDLKLELYHRRERQTMMEERMEKLESDKTRAEEMNDKLLEEMEKRDKAVEEAVAMIVMLEANVAELTKERNMVRQVEAQGFYGSPPPKPRTENPPPDPSTLDVPQLDNEAKTINRMPSFLSDRSERTENLRNVYLGTRGSVLSLSRVAEASDMDNGQLNGLVSPTLSVLSESSFVSIYGQKGQEKMVPSKVDEPLSLDGTKASPPDTNAPILKEAPTQTPRSNSFSRVNSAGQFQPIASIMEGSPLQRIERLDPAYSQKRETPRPASSGKSPSSCELGKTPRSPGRKVTREEKREALRRVMTDTPGGVSLHDQALPPTPDTVASSTLRRFKNSNDTLDRRHDGMEGRSQDSLPSLPHLSVSNDKLSEPFPTIPTEPKAHPVQLGKQRDVPNDSPKRSLQAPPRPRSADESTVSHRRDTHPWDLDSDSDTDSFESSLDIWLRAGSKPPRGGRASPDLFGFPTNPSNGSWSMNAMFGPNNTYTGGANVNPDSDKMYDLFSAQQALFGTGGAPPPPNRRSSLNAQTGSNIPPADDATPKPPAKVKGQKPPGRRARHFRRNSDDAQMRANMKTPVPGQLAQPPPQPPANGDQKRSHYPPIAGHQGARNGLSRLFRRSLGGTPTNDATAHPPPPNPEPVNTEQPKNSHQPGAPTWVSRSGALDDDRSGATPPPIQRKPCQGRGSVSEVESYAPSTPGMDGTPATPVTAIAKEAHAPPVTQEQPESSPAAGSATGSRRKWLPAFGRSSSLKKSG